jgi:starch phosphorylase
VFLENYDIYTARRMVQGVDVWLNTPRRPLEASGTSGMKAAVNGGIHLSVLDGWWCEGYSPHCGWAIGSGEEYDDTEYQDTVESQALYNLLENEVIPCFFDRPAGDVPTRWVRTMKASIKMAIGYFTSHRMMNEYRSRFYTPALAQYDALMADGAAKAKALVAQKQRLDALWSQVNITLESTAKSIVGLHVGDTFTVKTTVALGELKPDEVAVQVYYGPVNSENRIVKSHVEDMAMAEDRGNGQHVYSLEIPCRGTGRYGFTTRVVPRGTDWVTAMPGYVAWANGS